MEATRRIERGREREICFLGRVRDGVSVAFIFGTWFW